MIELQNKLDEMQSQINTYLSPENIKKDVTILGVLGNLVSSPPNIIGIPLYNTIEEMNISDINTSNIAIVYNSINNEFLGLYEKRINNWELSNTGLTAKVENVAFSTFYATNKGVQQGTLDKNYDLNKIETINKVNIFSLTSILSTNESNLSGLIANSNIRNFPNLNMANVTNITNIFYNCQNLSNIPVLDLSSVNNATNAFYNCTNLSSITYANITNFLPLAANLSNQYLSNMGLNINKFNDDQLYVLSGKGYIDAGPTTIQTYYEIQWE